MIEMPSDPDAEMAILGAAMLLPSVLDRVTGLINDADFYQVRNAAVFRSMQAVSSRGEPVDIVTITGELASAGVLEQYGGRDFLYRIAEIPGNLANVEAYARRVAELSQRRRLIEAGYCAIGAAQDMTRTIDEVTAQSEAAILAPGRGLSQDGPTPLYADASRVVEEILRRRRLNRLLAGISSGLGMWDWYTGGLQRSHLLVIAGRPAMGKTAALINVAVNVARQGKTVVLFSLEMSREQLIERILSSEAGIDSRLLRTGKISDQQARALVAAEERLSQMPLHIDDARGLTPSQSLSRARRLRSQHGALDMVAVDYLQIMRPDDRRSNRQGWEEIGSIAVGLKDMARALDVPVIALAQLNRAVEARANKRPVMSDLGESAKIEHEADSITFLYRPAYYAEQGPEAPGALPREEAEWIVGKNRHGETGIARLSYAPAFTRFDNI